MLNIPLFSTQVPGLERFVIHDCIGSFGRVSGVPKVPHVPQNLLGPPWRRPRPSSHPSVHDSYVVDHAQPHITIPVVAATKEIYHPLK